MDSAERTIGRAGLDFFGRMAAAISHDLKNVLAVVNENAGLLEDLCLMAERGRPLDTARLKRLAGGVKEQVRRGDAIIVRLNRFAHSVDHHAARIDLAELLELLAGLADRVAAARGVALEAVRPERPVYATTAPFGLLNLLWLCLEQAIAAAAAGSPVRMTLEPDAAGCVIRFSGPPGPPPDPFPTGPQAALCAELSAELQTGAPGGGIVLRLPAAPAT